MTEHTGFHEYKDGERFNPECLACLADKKREKIREHLIELFEQTTIGEAPDKLADAVLWVLNEDREG